MRTVAIGVSGEYGIRLVRFFENHLSKDIHIVRCTDPEQFLETVSQESFCIIEKTFIEVLEKEYARVIFLGEREAENTFCKYHSPIKLAKQIEEYFQEDVIENVSKEGRSATLIAIYSPIYVAGMQEIAMRYMTEGSLCLGMEDLGEAKEESSNMGALCYYIHLRKEDVTKQMQQMMNILEGRYFISSPNLYYDLADLSLEDLEWFFNKVKEMSEYQTIYVLLGSVAVKNVDIFRSFDQIIMVGKKHHRKLNQFWECFQQIIASYQIYPKKGLSMIYQEEM